MYYIIVNPASKTGKGKKIWAELEPVLIEKKIEYKVLFSKKAGHVIYLVHELCEHILSKSKEALLNLIVLGGDGTLNESLQGITDFSRVRIGYIPTGSSNDFARDMKYPETPLECLNNILDCREPKIMDLGLLEYKKEAKSSSSSTDNSTIGKRYFDVSCGIGYDAAICEEALSSPIKKFLNHFGLGKLVYLIISLKQLISTKNGDCTMTLDESNKIELPNFLFVASMIHQYEGGGFMFCPNADYHDGVIDICAVSDISKFTVLKALPKALKGKHFVYKGIEKYSASKITIETANPCWVHTDGEIPANSTSITLTCLKDTLQILG